MRRTITDIDRYIGQRIREARIAAKLSQDDLGNMLGVSYQQIQKYESGQSRIAGVHFGRLVSALNRPMPWFFPNSTEVRMPPR
jgi:transcriptional regulator with XRE-family HTH domain